jgi:Ribbon-helix-helix protein
MKPRRAAHLEARTARLTILIDPRKKAVLEQLCAAEDVTPSQLVRKLIRGYIEQRLGRPWIPDATADRTPSSIATSATAKRRAGLR